MVDLETINVSLLATREEITVGFKDYEEALLALYSGLTTQEVEKIEKRFRSNGNNLLKKCIGEAKSALMAKEAAAEVKRDADAKYSWKVVGGRGARTNNAVLNKPMPSGEVSRNNQIGNNGPRINETNSAKGPMGGDGNTAAQTGGSQHNGESGREESAAARAARERKLARDADRKYNIIIRGLEETGHRDEDTKAVNEMLLSIGLGGKIRHLTGVARLGRTRQGGTASVVGTF